MIYLSNNNQMILNNQGELKKSEAIKLFHLIQQKSSDPKSILNASILTEFLVSTNCNKLSAV